MWIKPFGAKVSKRAGAMSFETMCTMVHQLSGVCGVGDRVYHPQHYELGPSRWNKTHLTFRFVVTCSIVYCSNTRLARLLSTLD